MYVGHVAAETCVEVDQVVVVRYSCQHIPLRIISILPQHAQRGVRVRGKHHCIKLQLLQASPCAFTTCGKQLAARSSKQAALCSPSSGAPAAEANNRLVHQSMFSLELQRTSWNTCFREAHEGPMLL
eukprot:1148029-Pelagomonas_calceolata.AAC.1